MKFLVTGASGFVGRCLTRRLVASGHFVRAAARSAIDSPSVDECVAVGDIDGRTVWGSALDGVEVVVHLAARVHVMRDTRDGARAFMDTNTDGSLNLAAQAAAAGVRRFVFVSSIKVNGEETHGRPFTSASVPAPVDPYGVSKLAAEQGLSSITNLECVVVRPPLVYGPGVKGNLLRFCRLVELGLPVPIASIDNRRDLVSVENLVHLLECCGVHPSAPGRTFLASDGHPLSTPDLYASIATAMGRPARMFRVPVWVLRKMGSVAGLSDEFQRLTGSLEVDISATRSVLGWAPPQSVTAGIEAMVRHYLERAKRT